MNNQGRRMDRETTAIKENPRQSLETVSILILALRQRQLPTKPLACGIQSAYNSLVYRRANCFSIFSTVQEIKECLLKV